MNKVFGKIISLTLLSLFVLPIFIGRVSAKDELFFGQNHFYTVIFRGNGEAITYAKIAITNPNEKPLKEFSFEIPRVSPTEIAMYQIKLPQECVRRDYNTPGEPCLEWRDPDYAQERYYYPEYRYQEGKTEYQKIQYTKSGNLYHFTLPTPVEPYKSTAIVIAYAAKGYVKKSFGLFKFNFETIKVPSRIEHIKVAVDVDTDLLLKGKRAKVDYGRYTDSIVATTPEALSSLDLDRIVGKIGSYGLLIKEAKSLAPNETLIVRGEYATNWFSLYLSSILITILIIAAIFAGIYFLAKFLKRRGGQSGQLEGGVNQQISSQTPQGPISIFNLTNASVSFLSAVLVVGLTYLLILLESDLLRFVDIDPMFGTVGFIAIILLYVLVIFVPAIIVAIKHGWKPLVSILIAEFLWLVIFLIIYLALFQSGLISNISRGWYPE